VSLDNNIGVIYSTILNKTCDDVVDSKTQVTSTMSLINERMINGVKLLGYDLGPNFKKLTQVLLGLQTKTLTVIAANQSVGKTQLTENLAMFLATELRVPTLWFTLEMDNDRMTYRHLSILSGLPLTNVQLGQLTMQEKMERLDPAAALLARSPFYLNDSGHDAVEAMATARNYVIKKGVRVIVIDYVQLQHISSIRSEKRYQELGMISKGWKKFAKDMDASIVLISQLNRDAIDSALAKAEHGSGSYEIAQDADTYITLKERDTEEGNISVQNGNIMMYVDKNRMGTPDVLIPLYSERTTQRMMEV
jgi:replicative DNA helicase